MKGRELTEGAKLGLEALIASHRRHWIERYGPAAFAGLDEKKILDFWRDTAQLLFTNEALEMMAPEMDEAMRANAATDDPLEWQGVDPKPEPDSW